MRELARRASLTLLLGTLAVAGCYNPHIANGGFFCAEAGKLCPDGFSCDLTDHKCYTSGSHPMDAGTCPTPPVTPLCQVTTFSGDCDPACQVGCSCGRCNVNSSGTAFCTNAGPKTLGQLCTLGNGDDCAPGLICLQEMCGNLLGRCYRHCDDDTQCNGGICQVPIKDSSGTPTSFRACSLAAQTCDPVQNTGCPSTALNCYLTQVTPTAITLCDCPINPAQQGSLGDPCTFYNDCGPGYICIANVGGLVGPHCQPVCNVATPVCPSTRTCVSMGGGTYGYCGP